MAANIDANEVRRMAALCKLEITEEEEALFATQFALILDHMAVLNNVDTTNVEPCYNTLTGVSRSRLDEAKDIRARAEILANAPETDGEYFVVPRIV